MFDFYQKRKLRTVMNSVYVQGFLMLLVLTVGWSAYVRYDIAMEMSGRREQAEEKAVDLQAKWEDLDKEVKYLSSDRGIEAERRRQFDMALEGEQVVVIVEKDKDEIEIMPLSSSTKDISSKKWYQFWR